MDRLGYPPLVRIIGAFLYILSLIDKLMIGSLHHGSLLQQNELRFIVNLNWLNVKRV